MKYLKESVNFLKEINENDEIVIIFNNDGDGICSCSLLLKYLQSTGRKKPYIISQPMPMDKNIIQKIKTTLPNKIIFLDLVVDQQEDIVKKIRSFADILIVDHHQIVKNLNKPPIVHFNPRFTKKDIYLSTTYCIYKICSEIIDMSKHLWISAIGMISDYNLDDSSDLVNFVKKNYNIKDISVSNFKKISDMIFSATATKDLSCEQLVEMLVGSYSIDNLESKDDFHKLQKSYEAVQNEISSILADIEINSKKTGNIVMYNMKSKYNLNSLISTKLSEKYLDKLVIIFSKVGSKYKVSARNQKKNINASKVMQLAAKGLRASGGGHEAAAGATVDESDWEKFKERVIEIANN